MTPQQLVAQLRSEAEKIKPLTVKRDYVTEPLILEALAQLLERPVVIGPSDVVVYQHPTKLTDEEYKRITADLEKTFPTHRVLITQNGGTVVGMSDPATE